MNDKMFNKAKMTDQEIRDAYTWNPRIRNGSEWFDDVMREVADAATRKALKEVGKYDN